MFNDPEWASKEEWDVYAWFGFALSEAQTIEMLLQVLVTALSLRGTDKHHDWPTLYDGFGKLRLRDLFKEVKSHKNVQLSETLLLNLTEARKVRNRIVHGFFRPSDSPLSEAMRLTDATRELQMAASLFRNCVPELERVAYEALDQLGVTRAEVEATISKRSAEMNGQGSVDSCCAQIGILIVSDLFNHSISQHSFLP